MQTRENTADQEPERSPAAQGAPTGAADFGQAPAGGADFAAWVLRLQRTAGNRAVTQLMRQPFPHVRPPQTGPPARLPPQAAYERIVALLSAPVVTDGMAKEVHFLLWALDADGRQTVVTALDRGTYLDTWVQELAPSELETVSFVEIIALRKVGRNKGLAKKLLSYGLFDWEVTDEEAQAAARLLDVLPLADRKELEESWFGERLKENFPGSPDYEPAIGRELITGAVVGDFKEDPGFWHSVGAIAVGFVPYAGQAADIRDTLAALKKLNEKGWTDPWEWLNLVLIVVGYIPGFGDFVKALGRSALKWLRRGGKKLVGEFFQQLAKRVLQPVWEKAMKPIVVRVRKFIDDVIQRYRKPAPSPAPTPTPKPAEAPKKVDEAAAKGAAKGLDEAAETAIVNVAKGNRKALAVVERVAMAVVDELKRWADKLFKKAGEIEWVWAGIEGDYLVIYGKGSTIRLVKVRISSVKKFVVEKTEKLLSLGKERAGHLDEARKAADDAVEALERRAAIEISEEIGERIADMLVRRQFKDAKRIYRGAGSGVVDLVYEWGERIIVVEAKGGASRLGYREIAPGVFAQQGTFAYLDDIVKNMVARGGKAKEIAEKIKAARADDLIEYVISKTGKITDTDAPFAAALSFPRR